MSYRLLLASSVVIALASAAHADTPTKEAGKHFQRGVALYNEADYRAALVEFRRAYEIAPNSVVLYNIGETQYQLQNYAAALTTLDRYLNESGTTATHRPEVEQTLEILRARVGKVEVKTNIPDCEVTIDDEVVGKSPLTSPVLVSIGRRKVTAMHTGRQAETRFVEVAAGDTVGISLALADPEGVIRTAPTPAPDDPNARARLIRIGWITTGVLAVGALTTGALAWQASSSLDDARHTFGETPDDLQNKASRVTTLSAVADIIGAVAIVTGGVTLGLTLTRSRSHEVHVGLAPKGVLIGGTFP